MLLKELIKGQKATYLQGNEETEITGLSIDSREVTPGVLFACIPGAVYDGNRFAGEALERGAAALMTDLESPKDREVLLRTCPCPHGGCLVWAPCQKNDPDRDHRHEGKDYLHIYGEIHSGKCGKKGRTDRHQ